MTIRPIAAVLGSLLAAGPAISAPLWVPFDFARGAIGLNVTVKGAPLFVLLDTGVDPSVIDTARAAAVGLKIDRGGGGEASGEGDAKQVMVYPTTIRGLVIEGRAFKGFESLATDTASLSAGYGRTLDGVLGHSFLTDKTVLIDYANSRLGLLDRPADAAAATRGCRKRWRIPLTSFKDDSIPIIPGFRFGAAPAPISLDTGSNGGITLYQSALDLPGLKAVLTEKGETAFTGARGVGKDKTYVLGAPVGFGPFTLPAGEIVSVSKVQGSTDTRVANIGNRLFAAMKLKMLLDYRARRMTFYGDCPDG